MADIKKWTPKSCLETYDKAKINKIEDCLNKDSIARIKRKTDLSTILYFLRAIIADTVSRFNVSGNMNEDQVKQTADDMLKLYYFLSIEDFKLCFENGRRLRYGQVYRMDGSVLLGWLDAYVEERAGISEQASVNKHNEALSDIDSSVKGKDFYDKFTMGVPDEPKKEDSEEVKKLKLLEKTKEEYHEDPKAYMEKLKKKL